jgi:phytoene dehydrogenase-like protein
MRTAAIIGSGPNGLSAAIVLAAAGIATTVFERNAQIGGACSSAETTLPNFRQDLGSSAYPMGAASPFFRSLPIDIPWIEPTAPCAHPLDDGTAVMLEHSIEATVATLDACDGARYRSLIAPLASEFADLSEDILGPIQHIPKHPLILARFGSSALLSAVSLARSHFKGKRAQAFIAGMATHSVLSLEAPTSAAVGLIFLAAGHASGWPILRGGAQTLPDALARIWKVLTAVLKSTTKLHNFRKLTSFSPASLPGNFFGWRAVSCPQITVCGWSVSVTAPAPSRSTNALSAPIPRTAAECSRAATVHIGGSLEDIVESERTFASDRPFVVLGQPSLFDPSRAPVGQHTAWAYCHVPNGSAKDYIESIERQIARFAPDFGDCILARSISSPAALERWNPNLIGGDFLGGSMDIRQLLFRPTRSLYRTPRHNLYLCGASTRPGGGVHGMAGYHAATTALADLTR